ncbi:MAG: helix-turn-helix domain-containing protein [Candidatus Nanosyncoccus sp.]
MQQDNDKWMNVEELASYLNVSTNTIRAWIKNKSNIPLYKVGKMWRCKATEIDEWVKGENK